MIIKKIINSLDKFKVGRFINSITYKTLVKIDKLMTYFKKDAYIVLEYVHESIDGELVKQKDAFTIYICEKNVCKSLFFKINWEEAEHIVQTLREAKGKVLLEMDVGMGGQSTLLIPSWAKSILIEEIEEEMDSSN